MPNHWHMVVRPREDRDLSEFMRWLTVTHTQRWHAHHHTSGTGHLYQGRYKSFPVQEDPHFLIVCRYVERNALRAGLAARAQQWRGSSLWHWTSGGGELLSDWPVQRPGDWIDFVNEPQSAGELEQLRQAVAKGRPFGQEQWEQRVIEQLQLAHTCRDRGRPAHSRATSAEEAK